jgi:hypothetical protein
VCPLTVGCCRSCRWSSSLGDWASWVACLSRSSSPRHDCQYRCRRHSLPRLGAHESARDDRQPPTADSRTLDNLNLKYTHTKTTHLPCRAPHVMFGDATLPLSPTSEMRLDLEGWSQRRFERTGTRM